VYERKKRTREKREQVEKDRRWRWKLAQGRVGGIRIGEGEHGDQFS
jgi:phospholipase A2